MDCGGQVIRRSRKGPRPKRCPVCLDEREAARQRADKSDWYWNRGGKEHAAEKTLDNALHCPPDQPSFTDWLDGLIVSALSGRPLPSRFVVSLDHEPDVWRDFEVPAYLSTH